MEKECLATSVGISCITKQKRITLDQIQMGRARPNNVGTERGDLGDTEFGARIDEAPHPGRFLPLNSISFVVSSFMTI